MWPPQSDGSGTQAISGTDSAMDIALVNVGTSACAGAADDLPGASALPVRPA